MSLLSKGEKVPVPSDPMQESISKCIREEQACSCLPCLVQGLEGQIVVDDGTSDSSVELRMNKCKRISKKKLQKMKRKQRTAAN
nr:hypothetical protein [Tanacetum cinerariifolium]